MTKCPLCGTFIVIARNIIHYEKGIGKLVKQIYECKKGHKFEKDKDIFHKSSFHP